MYAIIEVGSKQYKVKKDDVIEVARLNSEAGKEIILDKVLLLSKDNGVQIGQPYLEKANVKAQVIGEVKARKVVSFKYRRRKSSHWKKGHRQKLTLLKIKDI